jgi:hypothetical protein
MDTEQAARALKAMLVAFMGEDDKPNDGAGDEAAWNCRTQ